MEVSNTTADFDNGTERVHSSEGIQIGNVGCAAGIVGTWTGAHHEDGKTLLNQYRRPKKLSHFHCVALQETQQVNDHQHTEAFNY